MSMPSAPLKTERLEIQKYERPKDVKRLSATHASFMGAPHKHPFDNEKILLIADPLSSNTFYYEFKTKDISYVEELPNLVDPDGGTVNLLRIWVKKMSVGVRCTPFIVGDTLSSIQSD